MLMPLEQSEPTKEGESRWAPPPFRRTKVRAEERALGDNNITLVDHAHCEATRGLTYRGRRMPDDLWRRIFSPTFKAVAMACLTLVNRV